MKYTIDDAVHFMRKKQASIKRQADKYSNDFDTRRMELLKASDRMGIIAEWLTDYKRMKDDMHE